MFDHPLARLGWRAELQCQIPDDLVAARVLAVDRGSVVVDAGDRSWRAPLAGRLKTMPATGGIVGAVPDGPVRAVLPRRGVIARRGDGGRPEVLAANVDLALLATSPNRDLNPRRLVRFLAITTRGDVEAVVLLTKSDLVDDPRAVAADVEAGLDGTPVLPVSAIDGSGLDELRALLRPGRTAVMLGTSGVGKSTLLNVLLGEERQATKPIRAGGDDPAAATPRCGASWSRSPGGALLIDTPGLRLVAPLDDTDEEVPLLEKEQLRRERRARAREFHRGIYKEMRARKRDRERREGR